MLINLKLEFKTQMSTINIKSNVQNSPGVPKLNLTINILSKSLKFSQHFIPP